MSDPLSDLADLPGVPSALAAARDAVDVALRDRGRRRVTPEQAGAALLAGARASARLEVLLEGEPAGVAPTGPVLSGGDPASGDPPGRWEVGAIRIAGELPALAALIRVSPGQVLARLHTLAAREVCGEAAGRLRDDAEAGARMAGVTRLLTGSRRAPALVLAAVVHAEIATVRPFGAGDGVVARAAEHLVLVDAGIDPDGVLVPEAGHLAAERAYLDLLAGYADGSVEGVRDWLLHCAQALTRGVEESPVRRG